MITWMTTHYWMTFLLGLGAIDAVRAILSPSCPKCSCTGGGIPVMTGKTQMTGAVYVPFGSRVAMPRGNGVYHGLVRRA